MSEELGKIEKPTVGEYKAGRKLYFIPLIFTPPKPDDEFVKIADKYWQEVQTQLTDLETKLGFATKIYHELVPVAGEKGINVIEELSKGSHQIVKSRLERQGVELQLIEDGELLAEFMDWSKCLMVHLETQKVADMIYEFYTQSQQRRNKYIKQQIEETLKENETGILLMQEGHQLQFSQGVDVFYIAPPSLDEIRRWIRTHISEFRV